MLYIYNVIYSTKTREALLLQKRNRNAINKDPDDEKASEKASNIWRS